MALKSDVEEGARLDKRLTASMQPEAMAKSNTEAYSGILSEMESKTPEMRGAIMPASRDKAEATPQAVPLSAAGNTTGV